ncbi:hypothetical protein CRM22_006893 [Opisthorchis felineus]|uniref:Uncharacterized protein n=1 Tax=Opisthorchis felineus TaxID=147828 RepID=A0A4S2LIR2_OPIFE|nr:hypothetical protein CRM22_006893 [Opisthorchis felineus]
MQRVSSSRADFASPNRMNCAFGRSLQYAVFIKPKAFFNPNNKFFFHCNRQQRNLRYCSVKQQRISIPKCVLDLTATDNKILNKYVAILFLVDESEHLHISFHSYEWSCRCHDMLLARSTTEFGAYLAPKGVAHGIPIFKLDNNVDQIFRSSTNFKSHDSVISSVQICSRQGPAQVHLSALVTFCGFLIMQPNLSFHMTPNLVDFIEILLTIPYARQPPTNSINNG